MYVTIATIQFLFGYNIELACIVNVIKTQFNIKEEVKTEKL